MVTVPCSGDLVGPEITVTPNQARAARAAACRPAYKGSPFCTPLCRGSPCAPQYSHPGRPAALALPPSLALLQLFPRKAETKDAPAAWQGDACEAPLSSASCPLPAAPGGRCQGAAPLLGWAKAMGIVPEAGSSRPTHRASWRKIFFSTV